MSRQSVGSFSQNITNKLDLLRPPHNSENCIFRVHDRLRKKNADAYEPTTIAIGPYHRGKKNLQPMEEHKLHYLQQFLQSRDEKKVDRYIVVMRDLEERARKCYGEYINLDSDEFVEMMLLDGVFITHFLRKFYYRNIQDDPNDPIFRHLATRVNILFDLLLLENQLPFFILVQLIDMTTFRNAEDNAVYLVHNCFCGLFHQFAKVSKLCNQVSTQNFNHILGFMHDVSCSSFAALVSQTENKNQQVKWGVIKCVTELREAGVQFKKSSNETISLFDIKFENGVLEIPPLLIDDFSECIFRNLIAYEQYSSANHRSYVADYMIFMYCLVNSAKDIEKLRHKGIIVVNCLGDDEAVSAMFNKLCNEVILMGNNSSSYSEVFNKLNIHCEKRRNIWFANLRRNYFNSPWSIISFIAAALLLVFTSIQTIYSVRSYYKVGHDPRQSRWIALFQINFFTKILKRIFVIYAKGLFMQDHWGLQKLLIGLVNVFDKASLN